MLLLTAKDDNQAAEHDRVFSHGLGQSEGLDSSLHRTGVVAHFWLVQFVVRAALLAPDIGIGMASPLTAVVALDATQGLTLEFIHMKDEVRHGGTLVIGDARRVDALHEGTEIFHTPRGGARAELHGLGEDAASASFPPRALAHGEDVEDLGQADVSDCGKCYCFLHKEKPPWWI